MDILDVVVLAGRGSARASEDRGAWLEAGAARVRPSEYMVYFSIFLDPVVVPPRRPTECAVCRRGRGVYGGRTVS